MTTALPHLSRLELMLTISASTYGMVLQELTELWNSIDHDTYSQFFCHYPARKAEFLLEIERKWDVPLKAFPSARTEIEQGIDCYALGHNAACVFHMSRVGEIALRIIARERGVKKVKNNVPVAWGTWGVVLSAIQGRVNFVRNKPAGPKKDTALSFYDKVLSDLRALQTFRDQTMHLHKTFDDGEAQSAMFRARELMTILATRLNENSTRAIPWSAWK